jgi:hypothetical protein
MLLVQLAQGLPLLTQVRVYAEDVLVDEDNTGAWHAWKGLESWGSRIWIAAHNSG